MGDTAGQDRGSSRSLRADEIRIRVSRQTRDRLRELADAKAERLARAGASFRQVTFDEIITDLIARKGRGLI